MNSLPRSGEDYFLSIVIIMEKLSSESSLNVTHRKSVDRNDIATHTALFRQHVMGLVRRDEGHFLDICQMKDIVAENTEDAIEKLIQLFASEGHPKRRNKLKDLVTKTRY